MKELEGNNNNNNIFFGIFLGVQTIMKIYYKINKYCVCTP